MEAAVVKVEGNYATLKLRKNGREVKIHFDKLSDADVEFFESYDPGESETDEALDEKKSTSKFILPDYLIDTLNENSQRAILATILKHEKSKIRYKDVFNMEIHLAGKPIKNRQDSDASVNIILVTEEQVKRIWVNSLSLPRSLDSNYHQIVRMNNKFKEKIRAGHYDSDAWLEATYRNMKEYHRTGQDERALLLSKQIIARWAAKDQSRSADEQDGKIRDLEQRLRRSEMGF